LDPMHRILTQTPLFSGLTADQVAQLRAIAQERAIRKGETVFWEGEEGIGFYIVAEGLIKIFKLSAEGKEQILHIYGPGHPFGEVPVFAGRHFPANAQAVENSRVLFFPRPDFIHLITANPSLAMNMLAMLSMRLRQFTVQVENLSLKEVPGRLAAYLIYLSSEQQSSHKVTLPISKGQLASLLGTIPETLSRIFNRMAAQGLITVQGAEITLLDRQVLEELALNGRLTEG
jgi:CRP/FNR family transcriptional regulator, dissimilatory nitrate respiration regulator